MGAAASPSVSSSPVAAGNGVSTPALPPATIDVSPAHVQVGNVTLSLAIEPARHMVSQTTALAADPDPAHQPTAGSGEATASTALVLDGVLKLTNNVDASHPLPDDMPQSIIRHVNVQVLGDGNRAVPYLTASVELLLDGHPTLSSATLVPMIAAESPNAQLYYGNNLKLMQRGTYQMFVRLQPNVMLGKDPLPTAQFNLVVR